MFHSELTSGAVTFGYGKGWGIAAPRIADALAEALEGRALIVHDVEARIISVTAPNNMPFSRAEVGNILVVAAEVISNGMA